MEHISNDSKASKNSVYLIDNLINISDDYKASKGSDNLIDEDKASKDSDDYSDDDDSEDEDYKFEYQTLSINSASLKDIRDVLYALCDYFDEFEIEVASCPSLNRSPYNCDFIGLADMDIFEIDWPLERMSNVTPLESEPVRPIRYHSIYKFFCDGKPGIVLEMYAKGRRTNYSIITLIQNILHRRFSYKMGLGGMLMMNGGQLLQYKPKFASEATYHHINCDSEITCTGTIVNDPMQIIGHHDGLFMTSNRYMFQFPSKFGNGLFVNDITPKETEYIGYFNVANSINRW